MKKIVLLICVLVIAVLIAVLLPGKVEDAVVDELREQGRRIFGTEVVVSGIEINIKNGTALIKEISIANPENYSQPNAITLSSIFAKFNYKSGIIEEIVVSEPHIFAEFDDKNLNILDLANHAESARRNTIASASENQTPTDTDNSKSDTKPEKASPVFTIKLAALEKAGVSIKS